MKIKPLLTTILSCGLLVTTISANADVLLNQNDSYIATDSFVRDNLGNDSADSFVSFTDTTVPGRSFDAIGDPVFVDNAEADASAYFDADFYGPDIYSAFSMDFFMDVSVIADSFASDGEAFSSAESVLDITFTTDERNEFYFGAEIIEIFGSADFSLSLTNSMGDILFDLYVDNGDFSPGEYAIGGADTYNLVVAMTAWADVAGEFDFMDGGVTPGGSMYFEVVPVVVPVPAAVWLFGSGLIGLIGVARRKR